MISELKLVLKTKTIEIRATRQEFKKAQRENNKYWIPGDILKKLVYNYRHEHIAYCMMRGTPYERIEKPAKGNEPDFKLIQRIQSVYTQDVCACS